MALETNLNVAPYYDDFDETKNYYKILFRPGVAVQTRELNQLQSILQTQIERFGDNIFKRGTIVDGCNFSFYPSYNYVKLVDTQKDGLTVIPGNYVGYFARSVNTEIGVTAYVKNYVDGFESTDPDLKTIYVDYTNSGRDGNTSAFTAGEVITIYDPTYSVYAVTATNGGVNFSNGDSVVFTSAIVVNVSSGSFTNGQYIHPTEEGTTANLQIIGIDTTTLQSANQVILRLKPVTASLINAYANSSAWTIANSSVIKNLDETITATVEDVIGAGASAVLTTDSAGKIVDLSMKTIGSGYTTLPHVTVKSPTNSTGLSTLNLTPRNYIANVQVAQVSNAVGSGYAFGVSDGVVYQKGYFEKVNQQVVIVEKYTSTPNALAVGFDTVEEIIDSNIDPDLLDNSTGTTNQNAPGANRIKLTPELVVKSSSDAASNDSFFVLAEWSDGRAYKQNQKTAYNKLNDEMARRTAEESGDYVVNKFQVTTKSSSNTSDLANNFTVVVDPGLAYISGYRVESKSNFIFDIPTGHDVIATNNQAISIDYGNYIRIKEVGGVFQFSTGDTVKLYSAAKGFLSNTTLIETGNLVPQGTLIGTANMRSMQHFDGTPGSANGVYKLYLFNINMNAGKNFRDVKSVYYVNGTKKGIADVSLVTDVTLNTNVALLESTDNDRMLFDSGVYSLKGSANSTYTYRTIDQTLESSNTGLITKSLAGVDNEYFTFTGDASSTARKTLYLTPLDSSMRAYSNVAGVTTTTTTSANVNGTSTDFLASLQVGDYVYLYANATAYDVKRVTTVINNTRIVVDSNVSFANTTTALYRYFPQYVPIDLSVRTASQNNHVVNVDATGKLLSIQFNHANGAEMSFLGSTSANVAVGVDIERRNISSLAKTAVRNTFVKLRLANNAANTVGPWCLGVPDAFRLRSVYVGDSSVNSTAFPDAIDDFYIDHNQTENMYDLSFLYLKPASGLNLTSSDYLLVKFDYGTSTGAGYLETSSYLGTSDVDEVMTNDSLALDELTTTYNTFEIPEVYTKRGDYYDLTTTLDFRPRVSNTVALTSLNESSAPVNPAYTVSFGTVTDPTNDKKFPVPQSVLKTNITHYQGRIDSVFVDRSGDIFSVKGVPVSNPSAAIVPDDIQFAMRLNDIMVKPYPNIPYNPSATLISILDRNIANEAISNRRIRDRKIETSLTAREIEQNQPTAYSMEKIGNLDRRISDLEYYVSLNLLESNLKDRVIPSSIDPTISRFKYGFFVDDFSTSNFSDVDAKSYAASIEYDDLVPEKSYITTMNPTNDVHPSYIEYPLVSQLNATGVLPVAPAISIANTVSVRKEPKAKASDSFNIKMADKSGPVTLYGHFYSGGDQIQIYQGNTLIKYAANAENLTTADKTFMVSSAIPSAWFKNITFRNFTYNSSANTVKDSFKLTWTHNPSNGTDYTIKVTNKSVVWRYAIVYPINSNTVANTASLNVVNNTPVVYTGVMTVTPTY